MIVLNFQTNYTNQCGKVMSSKVLRMPLSFFPNGTMPNIGHVAYKAQ